MCDDHQPAVHTRSQHGKALFAAGLCVALVAIFILAPRLVAAQMQYDFNGDSKVTCDDFREQYPNTYTDEATKALQQYPKELARLNGNPKENDIACEGQAANTATAKKAEKSTSTPTPTPTPQRATATPEPTPSPTNAPVTNSAESTAVPADVMARVEGCAVVAISERDVVGAGCPGIGAVAFRIPDSAPAMGDTVAVEPHSPLASASSAAGTSTTSTRPKAPSERNTGSSNSGKNNKSAKTTKDTKGSSSTSTTSGDKNDKKHGKHNKHHGKHKNKKRGKNDGK